MSSSSTGILPSYRIFEAPCCGCCALAYTGNPFRLQCAFLSGAHPGPEARVCEIERWIDRLIDVDALGLCDAFRRRR